MIVCAKCGNANEARDEFCGSCGAFLEWHGERVGEEPTPEPEPVVVVPAEKPGLLDRVRYVVGLDDQIAGQTSQPVIQTSGLGGATPPVVVDTPTPPVGQGQVGPYPPVSNHPQPVLGDARLAPPPPVGVFPPVTAPPVSPPVGLAPRPPVTSPPVYQPPVYQPPVNQPPVNPISPAGNGLGARLPGQEYERPTAHRPDATDLGPADLYCGGCGSGNTAGRRFCRRCGSSLEDAVVVKRSWWRRMFGGGSAAPDTAPRKGLRDGERPANWSKLNVPDQRSAPDGGEPAKRKWKMPRFRLPRRLPLGKWMAGPLLVLGLVGFGFPQAREAVTKWGFGVFHDIKKVVHPNYFPVTPKAATATSSAKNQPADYAIDKNTLSAWAEGRPGSGAGTVLTVVFSTPTEFGKVGFRNGAVGKQFTAQPRLKVVEVSYFDKENIRIKKAQFTLADKEDMQDFDMESKDVATATVKIISVYPGQHGSAASLKEVAFFNIQ